MSLQEDIQQLVREPGSTDPRERRNSSLISRILRQIVDELEAVGFITASIVNPLGAIDELRRENSDIQAVVFGTNLVILVDEQTLTKNWNTLKIKADGVGADELGILTTKGDLIVFSTEPIPLPVGTNTQVLTADSTAPSGMKWGDASGGGAAATDVDEVVRLAAAYG